MVREQFIIFNPSTYNFWTINEHLIIIIIIIVIIII